MDCQRQGYRNGIHFGNTQGCCDANKKDACEISLVEKSVWNKKESAVMRTYKIANPRTHRIKVVKASSRWDAFGKLLMKETKTRRLR